MSTSFSIKDSPINNKNYNPENISFFTNLIEDINCSVWLDHNFCIFNSIDNILYLIYMNNNYSIIFFNILNNQKINEIKNKENLLIISFKHYLDKFNKKDLIISVAITNKIKVWNIKNCECIYYFKKINENGFLLSACFLNYKNQNYIITTNYNYKSISEPIKIFDLNGNKIKEIKDSKDNIFFIETFYDKQLYETFIITGNQGNVKSYNYNKNTVYHKYYDNDRKSHYSIIIYNYDKIIKMVESSFDGNIRIWNFHSGELLIKINVCNKGLNGICLWNNEYLFVGCEDKTIKLINLNKSLIIKNLNGHKKSIINIKKIIHPKYGECLISQASDSDNIKLWIIS